MPVLFLTRETIDLDNHWYCLWYMPLTARRLLKYF
uniref:Uncharacterized protein n=1 Tax=Anguilla anguilla TaxID=7936 RepID=A0A0E9RDB8_ANGAN